MITELEIGQNSCCHYDLTQIIENNKYLIVPEYYIEDYYLDYLEDNNIEYVIKKGKAYIEKNNKISWENLYFCKIEAYSAINWYEAIKDFTYKSKLIPISNIEDIADKLKSITFPKFIKLDSVSPKDLEHNGIFYTADEVYNIFRKSERIKNTINKKLYTNSSHFLFIREPDFNISNKIEARCFIYHKKLTAVSCNTYKYNIIDKKIIKDFFISLQQCFPYNDLVVDILINEKNTSDIIICEINNFGADSPCGAGLFNWKDDYFLLHGAYEEVIFRYVP